MEIIPKTTFEYPGWLNALFYFSLILSLVFVVGYFVINGSQDETQKALEEARAALAKEDTTERIALEAEILDHQKRLADFPELLNAHLESSKVFEFLEKTCHPKVWFSQFSFDAKEGVVNLSGKTDGFESLGQQFIIFKTEPLVRKVDIVSVSISKEGGVEFSLSLSLDKQLF